MKRIALKEIVTSKKIICLVLTLLMVVGLFSGIRIDAKELSSLQVPTIKVKAHKNGKWIKITISKTKDAEGFEIFAYGKGISYGEYKELDDEYQKILVLEKNGNKKNTVTIKSLPAGSYKIKVRSFNSKKFGTKKYSEFSKNKAVTISELANGYKNSYDFTDVKKGDLIKFGAYEQDNNFENGQEPIEWIVLEKTKKSIFIVSKYVLDNVPINKDSEKVTWENCTLRKWLNEKFFVNAFNNSEKDMIETTKVENYNDVTYNTPAGNDTKDKIFILSQLDIINPDYGFADDYKVEDMNRRAAATAYAWSQGLISNDYYKTLDGEDTVQWWLRTPLVYNINNGFMSVECWGQVYDLSTGVNYTKLGVRPALNIKLTS